jgi:poly-gamma-glutamate synthesis protein (capsule biosynthesis protein)
MKKFLLPASAFTVLLTAVLISVFIQDQNVKAELIADDQDSVVSVTISFVGDLMCHSTQFNYARVAEDSFDFRPVYREINQYLTSPDFTIGNLETVTAGRSAGYSGYPFFNTPDDYLVAVKDAGFDLLVTANNHSLDKGEKGVFRTIEQINQNNMHRVGTFGSQSDRDSIRVIDIGGINISVLSYTYGTNGIEKPKGKDYIVNLIDYELIERDIKSARQNDAEIIIVYFHFGEEYKRLPNEYQKEVVNKAIESGADLIIGSHPHVIQPVDYFKTQNGTLDTGFIAYSLGNFFSNQRWRYSDAGVILNINLSKNISRDSIFISDVTYLPTWVFRGDTQTGKEYIILPSERYDDSLYYFLSNEERQLMKQAFDDTKSVLTEYNDKIKLFDLR